jgi:hypothetical protein
MVAMLVTAAPALAADEVIRACAGPFGLRIIRSTTDCFEFERLLTWRVGGVLEPQGVAGSQGAAGATGLAGPQGPRGLAGAPGRRGPAGAVGRPGSSGAPGPLGLAGASGPLGPAGAPGLLGPAGTTGALGAAGAPGSIGPIGPLGLVGPNGPEGLAGLAGRPGPRGRTADVIDSANQEVGALMFTSDAGTAMVARTNGAATYSLIVHPYTPIASMNGVHILFRGSTCEGTSFAFDPIAYGAVLPPPGGFGPGNEVFAADTGAPFVPVGGWTESGTCSADEDLSAMYLSNGWLSECSSFSWCGPLRPLKSMGILETKPPYAIRIP